LFVIGSIDAGKEGALSVVDRVRSIVEPLLAEDGLDCFDVEFAGGRLVVLADREGGVDLDALTSATHRISDALDRLDPVPGGRYILEVSSPGLERRLRTPDHFRRFVGSTVSVKTVPTAAGERRVRGVLAAADEAGITIGDRRIGYDEIDRAQTVFEWGPGPKPGKPGAPAAPKHVPHRDQKAPAT
jgi:ribosome maturation factor RimP